MFRCFSCIRIPAEIHETPNPSPRRPKARGPCGPKAWHRRRRRRRPRRPRPRPKPRRPGESAGSNSAGQSSWVWGVSWVWVEGTACFSLWLHYSVGFAWFPIRSGTKSRGTPHQKRHARVGMGQNKTTRSRKWTAGPRVLVFGYASLAPQPALAHGQGTGSEASVGCNEYFCWLPLLGLKGI